MPRPAAQHSEPVNSDSFLDIVASVVSIMIIMVVLEGARIKNTPVTMDISAIPAGKELVKDLTAEQSVRDDIMKLTWEIRNLRKEAVVRGMERNMLAVTVAAAEQTVQERRDKLDGSKRAGFDLARGLSESKSQLEQINRQREQVEKAPGETVVIESFPTPISRAVDGPEAHILLSNGRVVFIPLDRILESFQSHAKRQAFKLLDQQELTETIGPIEGFRLRYTLERHDISPQMMQETGRGGSYARLRKWSLLPASDDLGEPLRLALAEGSDFRRQLAKILPGRTAITIWVYPDDFDSFRKLRKELYRLNYTVAARPLPPGEPISGSPEGSKSAAQ
jgi:hypothetical protein